MWCCDCSESWWEMKLKQTSKSECPRHLMVERWSVSFQLKWDLSALLSSDSSIFLCNSSWQSDGFFFFFFSFELPWMFLMCRKSLMMHGLYYSLNQNWAYSTAYWEIWKCYDIFVISRGCILRTQILCSPNIQCLWVYGFIVRIAYYIIKDSAKSALLRSREYFTTPCSFPRLL